MESCVESCATSSLLLAAPPHAKHTVRHIKVGIEGGSISSGREQLMNDYPFWRPGDQKRVRPPQAPSVVAPWGSFAARAAVHRTCYEVTLRCQRVLARYSPGEDKLKHVAVGDPDPVPAHGYRACSFEWADEVSTGFVLLWCCTRAQGHHGHHLAGTGERVAAVHPNSVQGHSGCRGDHERHRRSIPAEEEQYDELIITTTSQW